MLKDKSLPRYMTAVVLFTAVFFAFFNYVMNHLYVQGSGVLDVGWFIHLMTQSLSYPPMNPDIIQMTGATFFSTHFSLFFIFLSQLYANISSFLSPEQMFATYVGMMYGFIALATFIVLVPAHKNNTGYSVLTAAMVAILASFNGVGLGLIGFPHIEIAIPALLLLFIALYTRGKPVLAFFALAFLLSIREDAGLHTFLLLSCLTLCYLIHRRTIPWGLVGFALVSLVYSVVVLYIQKTSFPGDSAFTRVYSGTPPYAHLTLEFLIRQAGFYFLYRAYIWVPCLVAFYLCFRTRNLFYLAGVVATLPWVLLSVTAVSNMPRLLANYYAFPLIVAVIWPLFAGPVASRFAQLEISARERRIAVLAPLLAVLLFAANRGHVDSQPWKNMGFEYTQAQPELEQAAQQICAMKDQLGDVLFDEPTTALIMDCIDEGEWGFLNNFSDAQVSQADTVIFFESPHAINGASAQKMMSVADKAGLNTFYSMSGGRIVLVSNQDPAVFAALGAEKTVMSQSSINEQDGHYVWAGCKLRTEIGTPVRGCSLKAAGDKAGFLSFGPYVSLPVGRYEAEVSYRSEAPLAQQIGTLDVVLTRDGQLDVLTHAPLEGSASQVRTVSIVFEVGPAQAGSLLEVRNHLAQPVPSQLYALQVRRL